MLVLGPLGMGSDAGSGQPLSVIGWRPSSRSYRVICSWSLPVLGLELHGRGRAPPGEWLLPHRALGGSAKSPAPPEASCPLLWDLRVVKGDKMFAYNHHIR